MSNYRKHQTGKITFFNLLLLWGLVSIATGLYGDRLPYIQLWPDSKAEVTVTPPAAQAQAPAHTNLSIESFKWTTDGLTVDVSFVFKNSNPTTSLKDAKIKCIGQSESGTDIDTNVRTIYRTFRPNKTTVVSDFNMGFLQSQVHTLRCRVESASVS